MPKPFRSLQAFLARTCVLLLICISLTACERESRPLALPYVFEQDVVLAFGDSLTYGTGAKQSESYPAVLSALIGRKVINAGVPGEITAEGLKRLPEVLQTHEPTLVLLCLGGNDFLRKQSAEVTERNLKTMLEILGKSQVGVVLIGVPRPGLSLRTDPVYSKLAREHNVLLAEDLISEVLGDRALKSDPIHPNAQGYRVIAEQIAEILDRHGAI